MLIFLSVDGNQSVSKKALCLAHATCLRCISDAVRLVLSAWTKLTATLNTLHRSSDSAEFMEEQIRASEENQPQIMPPLGLQAGAATEDVSSSRHSIALVETESRALRNDTVNLEDLTSEESIRR